MSEETPDTNLHGNDNEMHQETSRIKPQNTTHTLPEGLADKALESCEVTSIACDNDDEITKGDLPNCVEVNFVDSKTSESHLNCIKVRTVTSSSKSDSDDDLNSTASTESLSSAKDVLASRVDSQLSQNSESLSVDEPQLWERTQSEQDYESIPTCRICHCGSEGELLISPCLCTGTVEHVHHSCLMDWLKRCVKTKCELCLQPISVDRKTKPLKQWRRPGQKPTPIIWLLTFVVALTLNIASIAKDGSQKCVSNPCIIFYVVGAIGALLGFAFFYHFLIVSIRYVKQWMALNEDWTLAGLNKQSELGNANLGLSDKSLGAKERRDLQMVEIV